MKKAKWPWTPKILRMKCIHGDIWEYHTKWVSLQILDQIFLCQVSAVHFGPDCWLLQGSLEKLTLPLGPWQLKSLVAQNVMLQLVLLI